jgi:hypothetical protein
VILDRNVDLIPMLAHSWTYQALVHDVLDMKLNRVTVEVRRLRGILQAVDCANLNSHPKMVDCRRSLMTLIRRISSGQRTLPTLSRKSPRISIPN